MGSKLRILTSILDLDDNFMIYLLKHDKENNKDSLLELPQGSLISYINNKSIKNIDELKSLENIESIEFSNGEKYFLDEVISQAADADLINDNITEITIDQLMDLLRNFK